MALRIEEVLEELQEREELQEGIEPKGLSLFILANIQGALLLGKANRDPQVVATSFELLKNHLNQILGAGAEET